MIDDILLYIMLTNEPFKKIVGNLKSMYDNVMLGRMKKNGIPKHYCSFNMCIKDLTFS